MRHNATIRRPNPGFWSLLETLRSEERLAEVSKSAADRGERPTMSKKFFRELEVHRGRHRQEYQDGMIDLQTMWNEATKISNIAGRRRRGQGRLQ